MKKRLDIKINPEDLEFTEEEKEEIEEILEWERQSNRASKIILKNTPREQLKELYEKGAYSTQNINYTIT